MNGCFAHAGSRPLSAWLMPHSVISWSYFTLLICALSELTYPQSECCTRACRDAWLRLIQPLIAQVPMLATVGKLPNARMPLPPYQNTDMHVMD